MGTTFLHNPNLKTLDTGNNWQGTPVNNKGLFHNLETSFVPGFGDVWKWQTTTNPFKAQKRTELWMPNVIKDPGFLKQNKDVVVWLGHASFFIRIEGVSLLIDPVFGKLPMMKRHTEFPVNPEYFTGLDYVLVSHNHRDHCDKDSFGLITQLNPQAKVLTGLKNEELLQRWNSKQVIESAGWFQQYNLKEQHVEIFYLPSKHWSRRLLWDTNQHLWGAYLIRTKNKTIYFGGDSGYGSHFAETARLFPHIDIAMLGVGAFYPEWFMASSHTSPSDAVNAFHDLNATTFIPMHYGTFDLADEPLGEPLKRLQKMETSGKIQGQLQPLQVGEAFNY